jgi:uncharacterized protein YjbI with pentapeptide repeats
MANQEHVDILRQGLIVWNDWRRANPTIRPDLRKAQLNGIDLTNYRIFYQEPYVDPETVERDRYTINFSDVDLREASLRKAHLLCADLSGADLRYSNLEKAFLREASIYRADLTGARCSEVDLIEAGLNNTNLSSAHLDSACLGCASLWGANLSSTNLSNADLSYATVGQTIFGDIDLSKVKGLEAVKHNGPSSIGIDTIYRSGGNIPESFLRSAGVPDTFITYMRSLVGKPIEYYTCFISYSSRDQAFAERLYADLQSKNVRCWFDREDLKIGDKFWHRIDESIRLYDKLLVILSENSVASAWVENEVMTAFEKEYQQPGKMVLFPLKLDNTVMETKLPWAANMRRTRHIGDFTRWKEHDEYQKGLNRLLRDLKQEAIHDTIESDAHQD